MKTTAKIIVCIIINALAVVIASYLIKGIHLEITFINLLKISVMMGIVNIFIRPVIKILSLPFIILTFGLFTVIINTVLLLFISYIIPSLSIDNFWSALWGVFIISLTNYILSIFLKD